eukprot:3828292-Amphidinium_carterae.1
MSTHPQSACLKATGRRTLPHWTCNIVRQNAPAPTFSSHTGRKPTCKVCIDSMSDAQRSLRPRSYCRQSHAAARRSAWTPSSRAELS